MPPSGHRIKGVTLSRPFVFGSHAQPITSTQKDPVDPSHTHRWTIYVRGVNGEDLSYFVRKVSFKLHESFAMPTRVYEQPPYEVQETGWGEFEIVIKVWFQDPAEKPVTLYHHLQLYHKDDLAGQVSKKPVISETYDEFVFHEPTEQMYDLLQAHPLESLAIQHLSSRFNTETEQKAIQSLDKANAAIKAEIEKLKKVSAQLTEDVNALQGSSYVEGY